MEQKINIITKTTSLNQLLLTQYINKDSVCLDATVGNGNDTLFLAKYSKFVYGFDIQQQAIDNTNKLLLENKVNNYKLIKTNFNKLSDYISCNLDIVVFNFGYLPNSDKSITTVANDSLSAVSQAIELLNVNGLISLSLYWGHLEGKKEREEISDYCRNLDSKKYHVSYLSFINQKNCPPEIIWITRKK